MLSTPEMKQDLRTLWKNCFPDSQTVIHYFFRYRYRPENCLVVVKDGKVVSALHLLMAQITTPCGKEPIQYIYAAATLPEYRNTGCMTRLLLAAEKLGADRNIPYSAIVPSGQSLFSYYEQVGFIPYFQSRIVRVEREELKQLSKIGRRTRIQASDRLLWAIRNNTLRRGVGNLLWDCDAVAFAKEFQQISKGEVFSAFCDGKLGYAFFQKEEQLGVISEMIADEAVLPGLARQICNISHTPLFQFRLPVNSPLFPNRGSVVCTGMIKGNGNQKPIPVEEFPYIGLELG